jgi:3-methylfumaryl-CoA hydratase
VTFPEDLNIAHLRSWIGREDAAEDVLTVTLARRFHATLDLPGSAPSLGDPAPRLIHFCLAQPIVPTSELGSDGHPARGGFLPPVPLPRRMWAGGSITFHGDIRVGDAVRRVSRIADVVAKRGRTGHLCFVTVEHLVEANGATVLKERQDIVYRGLDASGPVGPAAPAEAGRWRRPITASAPLLFRYSALTFNSHRIHYDRRYVMEEEGYPGLVVHGPMQATLLLDHATRVRGTPPSRFSFRSLSTLFDGDVMVLHAEEDGESVRLWTAREGGPVAMSAEAAWS